MSDLQSSTPSGIPAEAADAIAAICLLAAFADKQKSDREQQQLKDVFESLGGVKSAALYHRVILGETDVETEAKALQTPGLRHFAFEMALSICDADGQMNEAETAFLERLRAALELPPAEAASVTQEAETLAALPVEAPLEPALSPAQAATEPTDTRAKDLDRLVLNAAILNGALELLPQTLATVAIMPLQLRMVYGIGQAYGYSLGREHLKEFLAIAGVGMTSQAVEGQLRKLFGGLAKRAGGKTAKRVVSTATGATMSFATTYALGQAAKLYYAGGRKLAMNDVRDTFQKQLTTGQRLYERYKGEVQEKSRTVNLPTLLKTLK